MAKQDTDQEPSIEEILNSIRQIISDDDDSAPSAPEESAFVETAPVKPFVEQEDFSDQDVIELTDRVEDEEDDEPPVVQRPEIEVDMREAEVSFDEPEPEPEEDIVEEAPPPPPPPPKPAAPKPAPRPVPQEPVGEDDSIFTRHAEEAAFGAFSELARKTAVEYGGITLEDIVRSELKPMLRDWLDRHLPPIIERLVQEELERVSKRVLEE